MSFANIIKSEMLSARTKKKCCRYAESYAYLLFANLKTRSNVKINYKDEASAMYFRSLFNKAFNIQSEIYTDNEKFILNFDLVPEDILKSLLNCMIDRNIFKCENCINAFVRGTFLSCGKVSDPKKEYHAEFVFKNERLAFDFLKIIKDYFPLSRLTERNRKFVVYIKDAESIENLLAIIGAPNGSMEIMQTAIFKDIRNHENRLNNFATANLKKTTDSGYKYLKAIETIEKKDSLVNLSDELQAIAKAKKDNIEMSLNELSELLKISRSAVYRGLNKIVKYAKNLK